MPFREQVNSRGAGNFLLDLRPDRLSANETFEGLFVPAHFTVVVISAYLPTEHSLFHAHVPLSATEVLLSQDRVCGTVYRLL